MPERSMEERSADRILASSPLVTVASFSARVDDPWFKDSGSIQRPIFVFPRTSVMIQYEGARPFAADPCTVTYYNPGQRYTRRALDPRGDHCDWFSVRPEVLRDVLSNYDPAAWDREEIFAAAHGPSDAWSYRTQRMVTRHLLASGNAPGASTRPGESADRLELEEAILDVLERLVELLYEGRGRKELRGGGGDAGTDVAERVRTFLATRFSSPLTLDDIADAAAVSVFHMCREFKRATGTTIHRYRNQLRLRRSLDLVADPAADLTRVALQVGYSSHSHFTLAFRRSFAMTPSDFRKTATVRCVRRLADELESTARTV